VCDVYDAQHTTHKASNAVRLLTLAAAACVMRAAKKLSKFFSGSGIVNSVRRKCRTPTLPTIYYLRMQAVKGV